MVPVVVSLHDVAPGTFARSVQMRDLVEAHGFRATLLVVPGPFRGSSLDAAPSFGGWLRTAHDAGHELALHGWEHREIADPSGGVSPLARLSGRLLARGCAEFLHLGADEAVRRIAAGRGALERAGIHAVGFTPPGWLASRQTVGALRAAGFRYTTTQWSVRDLRLGFSWRIAALSQRPGSSVAVAAAMANEQLTSTAMRRGIALRIAVHPDDMATPRLRDATKRMLDIAAASGEPMTYAELVDHLSIGPRGVEKQAS